MLELTYVILDGAQTYEQVSPECDEFFDSIEALAAAHELSDSAWSAGQAAVSAVGRAYYGDYPADIPYEDDDEDLDWEEWEADFLTCLADAPSLPKQGVPEHVEPRRAFWRWYLDEAVPEAYRSSAER